MTYSAASRSGMPSAAQADALLSKYGIVRVMTYTFEYGGYRYNDLNDAVQEARRRTRTDQPEDLVPDADVRWEAGGEG